MADNIPSIDPAQGQSDDQVTSGSSLPEDNGTPFQPAADPSANLDDTHQATDSQSNIDEHETYDAGLPAAAEAQEPQNPGIASYNPPATADDNASTDDADKNAA